VNQFVHQTNNHPVFFFFFFRPTLTGWHHSSIWWNPKRLHRTITW